MKRIGIILFVLIVIYFIFLIRQDIMDNLELKRETKHTAVELLREQETELGLKEKIRLLGSGSRVEELARTRLGLVKKSEKAYKVILDTK